MESPNNKILKVEVHFETELIFVLGENGIIYVLNSTLQNKEDGLIFKFKNPFFTSNLVDFFLPEKKDWLQLVKKPEEGKSDDKVEDFLLRKNLKPRGHLITVQNNAVQLWDFDDEFDKIKCSCKMMC